MVDVFLDGAKRFRGGRRPLRIMVRAEFGSGFCRRSAVDTAATVGRSLVCESVDELGVANVAELEVAIEGVDVDISVRNHNYGTDNL